MPDENDTIIAGQNLNSGDVVTCKRGELPNEWAAFKANAQRNDPIHGLVMRDYPQGSKVRLIVASYNIGPQFIGHE